jgi:hypothetical protein
VLSNFSISRNSIPISRIPPLFFFSFLFSLSSEDASPLRVPFADSILFELGADREREENVRSANDTLAVVLLVALRDYCALITAGVS